MAKGLDARINQKSDEKRRLAQTQTQSEDVIMGNTLRDLKNRDKELGYGDKKGSNNNKLDNNLDIERINRIIRLFSGANTETLRALDLNYILSVAMLEEKYDNYGQQAVVLLMFKHGVIRNIDSNIVKKSSEIFKYFKKGKPVILRKTKKGDIKMLWNGKILVFSKVIEKK